MDELKKKQHELDSLKSRHDRLENRLSDLVRKGRWNEEETAEMNRIKWEKRDLKEKIVQGEAQLSKMGESS
jgi:predicted  nucleic acid-binding Zn-ribbon protein